MEQVIDILESTRELLEDEKSWTQGAFARDKEGTLVKVMDEGAVQWCLIGAIDRVSQPKIEKDENYYNARLTALAVLNRRWDIEDYYVMEEEIKEKHDNINHNDIIRLNNELDTDHFYIISTIEDSIQMIKDLYESDE